MRTDTPENDGVPSPLEREAVGADDPTVKDVLVPFELAHAQVRVSGILEEEGELLLRSALHVFRKRREVALESGGALKSRWPRRSRMRASAPVNVLVRPRRISRSASRSPFCHASVHHHRWSAAMSPTRAASSASSAVKPRAEARSCRMRSIFCRARASTFCSRAVRPGTGAFSTSFLGTSTIFPPYVCTSRMSPTSRWSASNTDFGIVT